MLQLDGIKNIIFDLGGVIINLNQQATINAFKKLLAINYNQLEKELMDKSILEKFETNEYTTTMFIDFFKSYNPAITKEQIIEAWNSMLLDIPEERIFLIRDLARKYRVFLLSNTNEIHLTHINKYVMETFGFTSMSYLFEKAYYSHEIGLRKPDESIFKTVLHDKNLIAEETLFIDDSEQHILTAKQLNLKTYHLIKPETIIDLFHAD